MTDRQPEGPGGTEPVPRDLPDQQAQDGQDPLDVPGPGPSDRKTADVDQDLPEMDESGAGRGTPRGGGVHPEQPVPDESPG